MVALPCPDSADAPSFFIFLFLCQVASSFEVGSYRFYLCGFLVDLRCIYAIVSRNGFLVHFTYIFVFLPWESFMILKQLGPDNASSYFNQFVVRGKEESEAIRTDILQEVGDGSRRYPRTWGIKHAAHMVGRSESWLRENDPDVPRNEAGHGRWTLARINDLRDSAGTLYRRPEGSEPIVMAASKLKGGVGNTTFVCHAAHYFAMQGARVLVWDKDPQASATSILAGIVPDAHLEEEDLPNAALLDDISLFPGCIRKTYFHNVHLVPSNSALQDLDLKLASQQQADGDFDIAPHERAKAALDLVKDNYDIILIDCAPALGMLTLNALMAANALINPMRPSLLDLASYVMFTGSLQLFYQELAELPLKYHRIVLTAHKNTASNERMERRTRAMYGDAVLTQRIMDSEEISNAAMKLSTVYCLEKPIGARQTYERAIETLNACYEEIFDDLKQLWEMEAQDV